jgi:hypothetical protein
LVERINIDVDNYAENLTTFRANSVSSDLIQDIQKSINTQKARGNTEFEVELYVPTQLNSVLSSTIEQPPSYNHYCSTHNGIPMRDTLVIYRNASTGMIQKTGTTAKASAGSWINFIVCAGGFASEKFSIFGFGMSLLDLFTSKNGPVTAGSTSDLTYSNQIFDYIHKTQEVMVNGRWMRGNISTKAWLNRMDTYQYYNSTGKSLFEQIPINKTLFSINYNNPEKSFQSISLGGTADPLSYIYIYETKVNLIAYD